MDWLRGVWITRIYHHLRTSFWFLPTVMAVTAVIAAIYLVDTELSLAEPFADATGLYKAISLESARSILSTIAGAIITVVSLVFSMTLVALTLVSQQLGPRILEQFMKDQVTQIVLGLFVATFVFALIVLTRMDQSGGRVPGFAVLLSSFLAVLCLGAIIQFIHHIARRIQADVIVSDLGYALNRSCRQLIDSGAALQVDTAAFADEAEAETLLARFAGTDNAEIASPRSGYLNVVDETALADIAADTDLLIRIDVPLGSFCLAGVPVYSVATGAGQLSDEVCKKLSEITALDRQRTSESSVEFGLNALVEIALRALSPGINDPFTAMTCIDRLTDSLRVLLEMPSGLRVVRRDGAARVIYSPRAFDAYLDMAFSPVRQAAARDAQVLLHLCKSLDRLEQLAAPAHRKTIARAREGLRSSAEQGAIATIDLDRIVAGLPSTETTQAMIEAGPARRSEGDEKRRSMVEAGVISTEL